MGEPAVVVAPHIPYATAAKALLRAARRTHERGDTVERDQLLDEADTELGLMIDAMPVERRRPGRVPQRVANHA